MHDLPPLQCILHFKFYCDFLKTSPNNNEKHSSLITGGQYCKRCKSI